LPINIPSTNEPDVMAIMPSKEGIMYLMKVGTIGPSRASLSAGESVFIGSF
jgi:hypothetical protein